MYYNSNNNLLAVDGCYWACPSYLIVLDFSNPMEIVESKKWIDLYDIIHKNCNVDFKEWNKDSLVCKIENDDENEELICIKIDEIKKRMTGGGKDEL